MLCFENLSGVKIEHSQTYRSCTAVMRHDGWKGVDMGDKGGKKDKEKNKQQQLRKQKEEEQKKQDKARPKSP